MSFDIIRYGKSSRRFVRSEPLPIEQLRKEWAARVSGMPLTAAPVFESDGLTMGCGTVLVGAVSSRGWPLLWVFSQAGNRDFARDQFDKKGGGRMGIGTIAISTIGKFL
jgi:hypothetical protein